MKRAMSIVISGILLVQISCSDKVMDFPADRITGFDALQQEFGQPPKEYGTIPFFVWNDKMTKEGIDRSMQDFKDAGCGGVIVHPRPGLITEYLSDEWFDLFRYTVEKGRELDMEVWIYDENSYPSGFAGGHVPAEMPEAFNQGQGLKPFETDLIPPDYEKYFLILKQDEKGFTDITAKAGEEMGKQGTYVLFEKTFYRQSGWFGGFSYVDLLYPGVTEKFLQVTMDGYKKVIQNDFGKTVPGVFTDEPEISSPGGIRWTPDLFDVFREQWGYDLKENLPSLFKQVGEWKKVRHNYAQTMLWLFTERWARPASEYYAQLGLKFTGHYWEHGWPSMQLGPDNMAMYAWHSVPGIDMLFNQFNETSPNAQFGNIRSVKELASVANQYGRHRTLSETYGGAGWEVTFKDLKRLGDWEYALGVNLMNQHLAFSTIAGARKYDYPPSFSYHNPWMKSYRALNTYYARLSLALSSGLQQNNILVIEPTTTAWLYDSYMKEGRYDSLTQVGNRFQQFVTTLEKNQLEYDLGSEYIIGDRGGVEGKEFQVGLCRYKTVVIPPLTENLNRKTFDLLKKFTANGGKLIAFSRPRLIDGESSPDAGQLYESESVRMFETDMPGREALMLLSEDQDLIFLEQSGGNLYHHRRILKDGQLIFLANADMEQSTTGSFIVDGAGAVVMNAFTGEVFHYPSEQDGEKIRLRFSLQPAESLLLFVAVKKMKGLPEYIKKKNLNEVQASGETTVEKERENVLQVDFVDLNLGGKTYSDIYADEATQLVYKHHGFQDGDPWNHSVQYKTTILDRDSFPAGSGFEVSYSFRITEKFDWSGVKLVTERPALWTVKINGTKVDPVPGEWWLDRSFGVFRIGEQLKAGINTVTLSCNPMKIHAETEPVYILGEFSVVPAEKGWSIQPPHAQLQKGSWKGQGLPFYSWDMSYREKFPVTSKSAYYEVGLDDWQGTVAEVYVNGKHAGTIVLPTDRIAISDLIREGENEVEVRITGSLKSLLGPHYNNPKPGMTGPGHWRNVKTHPAGDQYQLPDYGLVGEIRLYSE